MLGRAFAAFTLTVGFYATCSHARYRNDRGADRRLGDRGPGQPLADDRARPHRPPIAAGFQRFLGHHEIRAQVHRIVAAEIADGETNPYESHPTLADRLRAVGAAATGEVSTPQAADSAAALLRDPGALELRLLESSFGTEAVSRLETINWEQTGELYATEGDALAEQHGRAFRHLTVVDAPGAAAPSHGTLSLLR
jgi:hypothetical protein